MTAEQIRMGRLWLRRTDAALDAEINQTMEAAVADLYNAGVNNPRMDSPLVQQAVKLYCKAQFGYNDDGEKYSQAYEYLKNSLALSGDF